MRLTDPSSGSARDRGADAGPRGVGGANTQSIMLFVDGVEAHCAQARAADLEGHHWWFNERVRDPQREASEP